MKNILKKYIYYRTYYLSLCKKIFSYSNHPLVSVIIPVYNAEHYIKECLDSLINQTLYPDEIICIDDGSNDNSLNILKQYEAKYKIIHVISIQHSSAGAARNIGLAIARGKYLAILDADDIYHHTLLFKQVVQAEYYNADIAVCRSNLLTTENNITPLNWSIYDSILPLKDVFSLNDFYLYSFQAFKGWTWDKIFRRSFIEKYNLKFQNIRSTNDALFCFMAIHLANSITITDEILVTHRQHNSSLESTRDKDPLCFINAIKKIKHDLNKYNLYDKVKKSFMNWVAEFCFWQLSTLSYENRKRAIIALNDEIIPNLLKADTNIFYNNIIEKLKNIILQ